MLGTVTMYSTSWCGYCRRLKTQLTSIGTTAKDVSQMLDDMRDMILARVCEAEAEVRAVRAEVAAG